MPSKKSEAQQIDELRNQLAQQTRLLAERNETIRGFLASNFFTLYAIKPVSGRLKAAEQAREFVDANRIPAPKGQAGRGDGYNLLEEMHVSKEMFHALRVSRLLFSSLHHSTLFPRLSYGTRLVNFWM